MRKLFVLMALSLAVCCTALAQAPAAQPREMPPLEQLLRMPVLLTVPGMDKVEVRSDLVYKKAPGAGREVELKADIYMPPAAKPGQRFPAVILVSGGGLEPDWRKSAGYISYGRLLAASGFVAVTFTKRYGRQLEEMFTGEEDTLDLVSFVRENGEKFRVHPDKVGVWVFSGGGPLLSTFMRTRPTYVRALVAYYAILQFTDQAGITEANRSQWEKFSAQGQFPFEGRGCCLPAMQVVRAKDDRPWLNEGIENFVKEGKKEQYYAQVQLLDHETGQHAFDILDDNERTREILRATIAFLQKNLGVSR
jgi:acetyl esterase/lipase